MSIVSYDSYFKKMLTEYLDKILSCVGTDNETYITDSALGDLEPNVVASFKKAFGGTNPEHNITVDYTFPDNTLGFDALYVLTRGGAQKQNSDIGNNVTQYSNWDTGITQENLQVQQDSQGYFLATSNPIGSLATVQGVSNNVYSLDDSNQKRINLKGISESILGNYLGVSYYALLTGDNSKYSGIAKGFSIEDTLDIYIISSNMDVLRCLDNLLKFIVILIKETNEGPFGLNLPSYQEDAVALVDGTPKDLPVYGIQVSFSYTSTYTVHYDLIKTIQSAKPTATLA